MPDQAGRRVWFYLALGLVTAATLMLQIIETRIISVISWYHLAFFIISIAYIAGCDRLAAKEVR